MSFAVEGFTGCSLMGVVFYACGNWVGVPAARRARENEEALPWVAEAVLHYLLEAPGFGWGHRETSPTPMLSQRSRSLARRTKPPR